MRGFELHRIEDVSGVSGTGLVAQGVEFDDGVVALRWLTEWPTSVVFHDRGAEAVERVHGHNGRTEVRWLEMLSFDTKQSIVDPQTTAADDVCNACGVYVPGGADPSVMSQHDCEGEEQ